MADDNGVNVQASDLSTDSALEPGEPVSVANCDREPIHIPGHIQFYGVLLALQDNGTDFVVTQASENVERFLAVPRDSVLGESLQTIFGIRQAARLREAYSQKGIDNRPLHLSTVDVGGRRFDASAHRAVSGELVLELEPSTEPAPDSVESSSLLRPDYYALIRKAVPRFNEAVTVQELSDAVAEEVQRVSGYDRVMVYRFDADGHGSVIAEVCGPDRAPFLGLHYPASDIPQQARRLYILNPLRIIADVEESPVPMIGAENGTPLDMSQCILRSPSPIHVEYLKNMGVRATLTISLVENGTLWGLIACHHYSPRITSYEVRTACEFIGQMASLQLAGKQESEDREYLLRMQRVQSALVTAMSEAERYQNALVGQGEGSVGSSATNPATILDFVDAGGAAVLADGECAVLGSTPPEPFLRGLTAWLTENISDDIWATDSLSAHYGPAAEHIAEASGLMALAITRHPDNYVLWFRPEVVRTVDWAGDPSKAVRTASDGRPRISPRESFELWKGTVRGKSLPWRQVEWSGVSNLRQAIVEIVLKKAEQVAHLNARLARSNRELDDFAYIASHDLKEPLRGIHNYAHFLQEDYADQIDEEGRAKLATLSRLSGRMEGLIDSLLSYSRFGRMELEQKECDLNVVLADVREDLRIRLEDSGAELRVPRPLPHVVGDPLQITALLANLISNAAKYNDRPRGEKWIEVGYTSSSNGPTDTSPAVSTGTQTPDPLRPVFYVRDNGIGIRERHFDAIFRLFKRLHGRDAYGGGAGAGLSIARKIAERHSGRLWVESSVGVGTTFYFTLAPDPQN